MGRLKAFCLVIVGVGIAALLPYATLAVEGESITASPATQRSSVNAGGTISDTITIINDGTIAYDYVVGASPFSVLNEDYKQSFNLPENTTDTSKWFKFSKIRYHLDPGQRINVPYTINVPANAAPGGHYAVVFATTQPNKPATTVVAQKRVGTIFYLTVNGALSKKGNVETWGSQYWQNEAPLVSNLRMRNAGNVHYDTEVKLSITDMFGNVKASPAATAIVLPQTIRKIDLKWEQAPSFGLFRVGGSVQYLDKTEALPSHYVLMMSAKFFLGMVTAVMILAVIVLTRRRKHNVRRR